MRKIYWLLLLVLFCNQFCKAQNNKEITVGGITFTMIFVEGGTFTMGATVDQGSTYKENEKPCHKVTLSDFYIGQFEVTQALWVEVMGYNPSMRQEDMNYPVENVSWGDCMEFINKLNEMTGMKFRLPTESEWEFAARGGNQSKWYKYPGSNKLSEVTWMYEKRVMYGNRSLAPTHPVGGKKPNELGIYDLATNVAEWCYDAYEMWPKEFAVRPQTNPTGPEQYSWKYGVNWIGQTEVTQELWEAVMGENPSRNKDNPKQPVTNVSWDDCRVFITRLNALTGEVFRMPTEAEWEFAARGGMFSQWYKFSGSNNREEVACDGTCPVATKKANELGIYDMSGTVKNWCKNGVDCIGLLEGGNNPQGCSRCGYRISRGGYDLLGIAHTRCSHKPNIRLSNTGLRLARSVKQKVVEED